MDAQPVELFDLFNDEEVPFGLEQTEVPNALANEELLEDTLFRSCLADLGSEPDSTETPNCTDGTAYPDEYQKEDIMDFINGLSEEDDDRFASAKELAAAGVSQLSPCVDLTDLVRGSSWDSTYTTTGSSSSNSSKTPLTSSTCCVDAANVLTRRCTRTGSLSTESGASSTGTSTSTSASSFSQIQGYSRLTSSGAGNDVAGSPFEIDYSCDSSDSSAGDSSCSVNGASQKGASLSSARPTRASTTRPSSRTSTRTCTAAKSVPAAKPLMSPEESRKARTDAKRKRALEEKGLSPEALKLLKSERKKERNRRLAAESRERRKQRLGGLEQQNEELIARVKELEAEVALLKIRLAAAEKDTCFQQHGHRLAPASKAEAIIPVEVPPADRGNFPRHDVSRSAVSLERMEQCSRSAKRQRANDGTALVKGAAAMCGTMSMMLFTDISTEPSSSPLPAADYGSSISIFNVGWGVVGPIIAWLLPNFLAVLFGVVTTSLLVAAFYFRTLRPSCSPAGLSTWNKTRTAYPESGLPLVEMNNRALVHRTR